MGLDLVELAMDVEETFGITISDEAGERLATPRLLIDYVHAQLQPHNAGVCLTQRAFHKLRRAAQEALGAQRAAIRPKVKWEALIPIHQRRVLWETIRVHVGSKPWPALHRSQGLLAIIAAAAVLSAGAAFVVVPRGIGGVAMPLAGVTVWSLGMAATGSQRRHFDAETATVGGTADYLATYAPQTLKQDGEGWTRDQVRETIHRLIRSRLNVAEFTDDSRFVEDMGLD
jgi:hypothetical protein